MATTISARLQLRHINSNDTTTLFLEGEPLFATDENEYYIGTGQLLPNKVRIGNTQAIEGMGLDKREFTINPFEERTLNTTGGNIIFDVKILDKTSTSNKKILKHSLNSDLNSPFTYSSGINREKEQINRGLVFNNELPDDILIDGVFSDANFARYYVKDNRSNNALGANYDIIKTIDNSNTVLSSFYQYSDATSYIPFNISQNEKYTFISAMSYKNIISNTYYQYTKRDVLFKLDIFKNNDFKKIITIETDKIGIKKPIRFSYSYSSSSAYAPISYKGIMRGIGGDIINNNTYIFVNYASGFSIDEYEIGIFDSNGTLLQLKQVQGKVVTNIINTGSSILLIELDGDLSPNGSTNLYVNEYNYDLEFINNIYQHTFINYGGTCTPVSLYKKINNNEYLIGVGHDVLFINLLNLSQNKTIQTNTGAIGSWTKAEFNYCEYDSKIFGFSLCNGSSSNVAGRLWYLDKNRNIIYLTATTNIPSSSYMYYSAYDIFIKITEDATTTIDFLLFYSGSSVATLYHLKSTISIPHYCIKTFNITTNGTFEIQLDGTSIMAEINTSSASNTTEGAVLVANAIDGYENSEYTISATSSTATVTLYITPTIQEQEHYDSIHSKVISNKTGLTGVIGTLTNTNNVITGNLPTTVTGTLSSIDTGYQSSSATGFHLKRSNSILPIATTHTIASNVKVDCTNLTSLSIKKTGNTYYNGHESTTITFKYDNGDDIPLFTALPLTALDISDTNCIKKITITQKGVFQITLNDINIMDSIDLTDSENLLSLDEVAYRISYYINEYQFKGGNEEQGYTIDAQSNSGSIYLTIIPKLTNTPKTKRGFTYVNEMIVANVGSGEITDDGNNIVGVDGLLRLVKQQLITEKFSYILNITDEVSGVDIDWNLSAIIFEYSSNNITKSIATEIEYEYSGNELLIRNTSPKIKNIEVAMTTISA